jgi:hypothetical protein
MAGIAPPNLDGSGVRGNTQALLMKRRAICNILVVAALLTALGTDYLASAGMAVRAEAVVDVAQRMATRFARAFPRRVNESAIQNGRTPQFATLVIRPFVPDEQSPLPTRHCMPHMLYLPPPLA